MSEHAYPERPRAWQVRVADVVFPWMMPPPLVGEPVFALWLPAARHGD